MNISKLIRELETLREEHGDLDVCFSSLVQEGRYFISGTSVLVSIADEEPLAVELEWEP